MLVFVGERLREPLTLCGEPSATLYASTTGTDADWVVKLIDLYPDEVPAEPAMGGYQLMISGDILRGRYRESFEKAAPVPSGQVLPYRITMPHVNHTFLPGHRILVQVQSSWFPVYDRNPQTFVEEDRLGPAGGLPQGDPRRPPRPRGRPASSSCRCGKADHSPDPV